MSYRLGEEERSLLRLIIESQAYRQLMAVNILGHSLKYVTDLESKIAIGEELTASMRLFRQVRGLYNDLGWVGIESAVRDRMQRIPYPESRLEFGLCRFLCNSAQAVAMRAYTESKSPEFADIASACLDSMRTNPLEEEVGFREYCQEEPHLPQARQWLERWLGVALLSFGRPGTPRDLRAVELGLRTQHAADMAGDFMASIEPFLAECRLERPDVAALGVELPPGVTS